MNRRAARRSGSGEPPRADRRHQIQPLRTADQIQPLRTADQIQPLRTADQIQPLRTA
jgi:hypothetical protein